MKSICLYFQIHQPYRLRKYNIFDMGNSHQYYDDYLNELVMKRVAYNCYLPANELMLELIEKFKGKFKVNFSITGTAIEQFEQYCPEVIQSFQKLSKTGCVEFFGETYSHSLSSEKSHKDFIKDVKKHSKKIKELFGKKPKVFRNTELIYSNNLGREVFKLGFSGMITEGAKHVMAWKNSNFLYNCEIEPNLKLLFRNYKLSDDIAFRFSDSSWSQHPLTAEKYAKWISDLAPNENIVNLFMDYETLGEHQKSYTGIFEFMRYLPGEIFNTCSFEFKTASEIMDNYESEGGIDIPHSISWADEERDLTAWLGNPMQDDASNSLYKLSSKISKCKDKAVLKDWEYLQTSDHFYYMSTKILSDGEVHQYFTPYETPYAAYIGYMNVLSDFKLRLDDCVKE